MGSSGEDEPIPPERRTSGDAGRPDWLVGAEEGLRAEAWPAASATPEGAGTEPETANPAEAEPAAAPGDGESTAQDAPGAAADAPGSPADEAPAAAPAPPPVVLRRPGSATPILARPDAGVEAPRRSRLPDMDAPRQVGGWVARSEVATELKPMQPAAAQTPTPPAEPDPFEPPQREFPGPEKEPTPLPDPEPSRGSNVAVEMLTALVRRTWKWAVAVAAAVLLASTMAQGIGFGTTPIRRILRDPGAFDGKQVKVRGRVSQDVFSVGGGYTYYLLQGRDSLVVYTRFRLPRPGESLTFDAQVSTGALGETLRPALLETEPVKK